ncbi:unnamed protein product [Discosporangium mesarthrocarpum]
MPFTLDQLSDRAEIHDLLVREAHALDKGDWEAWERCFTSDAEIDYSENDGAVGAPAEVRRWLAAVFAGFPAAQHLTSNAAITLAGDRASVRSMQYIGVKMIRKDGERVVISGIWFHDEMRRDTAGWKIARRREELAWRHNFPGDFEPPVVTT